MTDPYQKRRVGRSVADEIDDVINGLAVAQTVCRNAFAKMLVDQ
jgi:hypothetical protein